MSPDMEVRLRRGGLHLAVSPYGASLRGLWREQPDGGRQEIITGYVGAANKVGGQGDVLIPFPGRVAGGRYTFAGQTRQMPQNDKDGPNAIHGFLRTVMWEIVSQSETEVRFGAALRAEDYAEKGYPFSLRAEVTYRLEEKGVACDCRIANIGDGPAPVAAGFHPYFTVGSDRMDEDTLHVPFASVLEFDAHLIPTEKVLPVEGTPYDFRRPRSIGTTALNICFLHPTRDADGLLRIRLSHPHTGRAVTVWMGAGLDYLVVYSGDALPESHRRRALAIEPMTCGSDAFNHPEWSLRVLEAGEALNVQWGVSAD